MTDPNYWLAAWLSVMALFFVLLTTFMISDKKPKSAGFSFLIFTVNMVFALWCAGLAMVMP